MPRKTLIIPLLFIALSLHGVKANGSQSSIIQYAVNGPCLMVPFDSPFANPIGHGRDGNQRPYNDEPQEPDPNGDDPIGTATGLMVALGIGVLAYKIKKNSKQDKQD